MKKKNILESPLEWVIWAVMTVFLLWVLIAIMKGIILVFPDYWLLLLVYVPAGALDIWLLHGCLKIGINSSRKEG